MLLCNRYHLAFRRNTRGLPPFNQKDFSRFPLALAGFSRLSSLTPALASLSQTRKNRETRSSSSQ
ncbi:hypothetical protein NL676_026719 [Syzygium grande]|nr:hypothetical protein NL676_026719 [Syzygium grande]